MSTIPTEFRGVTAVAKANVYFDGKVVSHSILFPDGSKKTIGLIYPGINRLVYSVAYRQDPVAVEFFRTANIEICQKVVKVETLAPVPNLD